MREFGSNLPVQAGIENITIESLTGGEKVNAILYQAAITKATDKVPTKAINPEYWKKAVEMVYTYFTTNKTYAEIGKEFELTEVAVSVSIRRTFDRLVANLEEVTGTEIDCSDIGFIGRRGFESFSEEKRKKISAEGGRNAHQNGNAHEFTSDKAREAGRKGGEIVSRNREHMADLGRMNKGKPKKKN